MESFWQLILDVSANHITRYGLYIPGDPYRLVLWNELIAILLSFLVVILALRVKRLKNILSYERELKLAVAPPATSVQEEHEPVYVDMRAVVKTIEEIMEFFDFVRIWYADNNGEITDRIIEPIRVYVKQERYYLEAFCHLRDEERTFRLDRIIDIRSIDDDSSLTIHEDFGNGVIHTSLNDNSR
jgi:hypothetical protein